VLQPYDGKKFNFTKVGQEEVLFCFEESEDGTNQYYEKAPVSESPNVIAINVCSFKIFSSQWPGNLLPIQFCQFCFSGCIPYRVPGGHAEQKA
jgi:hypothetical protein